MTSPVRALWDAPPASPAPPRRVWRDWALVGVLAPLAVVEASLRPDIPWRWLWAAVLVALVPTLLWRRVRPLTMLAIAFGTSAIVGLATGAESEFFTSAYFLLLLYALFRWGSGRAMVVGGALVAVGVAVSFATGTPTSGDLIGGAAVVVTTGTLALAFRWRARARARELDQARLSERMQLARDLHDTVAHHVSAIAIQAQAGAVVATDRDAAVEVFQAIESEASRTLHEMRAMVGVLRADAAALAPTPTLGDLRTLADATHPEVVVHVDGDSEGVPAAVAAAVFRLAQEAVTNARRHARSVRHVDVGVRVDAGAVHVEVRDDGEAAASTAPGFGIRGMQERAALLGGTCTAGPAPAGGWLVTASLPRTGWTA